MAKPKDKPNPVDDSQPREIGAMTELERQREAAAIRREIKRRRSAADASTEANVNAIHELTKQADELESYTSRKLQSEARIKREATRYGRHRVTIAELTKQAAQEREQFRLVEEEYSDAVASSELDPDNRRHEAIIQNAKARLPSLKRNMTTWRKRVEALESELAELEKRATDEWRTDEPGEDFGDGRVSQEFEIVAEKLNADDLFGHRIPVKKGTKFVAILAPEFKTPRATSACPTPQPFNTGKMFVESSDCEIHPGCLTSLIRVEWAKPLSPAVKL